MFLKKLFSFGAVALLLVAMGCGGSEVAEAPPEEAPAAVEDFKVDPATAATVTGKVSFEGDPPKAPRINMSAEPDCAKLHSGPVHSDAVTLSNSSLQHVFIWVKSGLEGKTFEISKDAAKLDQKGCIYTPHVIAVQTNQLIQVSNSDPTTHNIHPLPRVNREWNKSQTAGAAPIEAKFPREEIMMPVKCNIHPWMRSYINVVSHPFFAVTGEAGTFEIKGLPPGTYTIEAIHEKFGKKESSVTLGDAESKEIEFAFSAS